MKAIISVITSLIEVASLISPKIVLIDKYKKAPEAKDNICKLYTSPITKPINKLFH